MIKTKMQMKETEVVSNVYCNVCAEIIKADQRGYLPDFIHVEKSWTYFSNKDGETQKVDICEKCWDKFNETFKIKAN